MPSGPIAASIRPVALEARLSGKVDAAAGATLGVENLNHAGPGVGDVEIFVPVRRETQNVLEHAPPPWFAPTVRSNTPRALKTKTRLRPESAR